VNAPVMMGITSPTGSHLGALTDAVRSLPPGAVVIEHGAGLFSTPLLSRADVEVLCIETHPGWSEWARWMYQESGRAFALEDSWKRAAQYLDRASLVFIDGAARDRGPLLKLCLEKHAPLIIVHDTEEHHWGEYQHHAHYFEQKGYVVKHDSEPHRTTVWRLA
jgi:hypothetical protein